jgi:hypothetical protein
VCGGPGKQSTSSGRKNPQTTSRTQKPERLGLREMERNGVVTKAYEARDFFVSFLIFQKRKNDEQPSPQKKPENLLYISSMYFCLNTKVPKSQGFIKISCFLQLGFQSRYKPRHHTARHWLLYRFVHSQLKQN